MIDFTQYFSHMTIILARQLWPSCKWAIISSFSTFSRYSGVAEAVQSCLIIPTYCACTQDKQLIQLTASLGKIRKYQIVPATCTLQLNNIKEGWGGVKVYTTTTFTPHPISHIICLTLFSLICTRTFRD